MAVAYPLLLEEHEPIAEFDEEVDYSPGDFEDPDDEA